MRADTQGLPAVSFANLFAERADFIGDLRLDGDTCWQGLLV
ncbi:hypothetical protein [Hyphomonas atlantica]